MIVEGLRPAGVERFECRRREMGGKEGEKEEREIGSERQRIWGEINVINLLVSKSITLPGFIHLQ